MINIKNNIENSLDQSHSTDNKAINISKLTIKKYKSKNQLAIIITKTKTYKIRLYL